MAQEGQEDLLDFAKRPVYSPVNDKYLEMYKQRENVPNALDTMHNLSDRDFHTIQYTKAQLVDGDTLIFIKFPNDEPVYHPTGFELRTKHVVHYEKLVACGSAALISALNSREQQLRLQRRFGLVGRMPEGIKYLLDLTPPGEGDEAVALTVLLSCPLGVRRWYTSADRCRVPRSLVGGYDELTLQDLEKQNTKAIKTPYSDEDPEEYCKIRHRTGIERLLQVIEGKDPRLDSAPKVWTLVMLAHHFGCAKVVEDHVLSWLLVEPNNRFIEILPEAALKIGAMLENEYITKYAFSVLVSEKALALGCGNFYREYNLDGNALMMAKNKSFTRLGRPIADVDEDWTNMIQYAAQAFASRIHQQVRELLSEDVKWVTELPEYQKIHAFEQFLANGADIVNDVATAKFLQSVEHLHLGIRDFVRGRLFRCILDPLNTLAGDRLHANRVAENHLNAPEWYFKEIYHSLNDQEKVFTRQFWENILNTDWSMVKDNTIFDPCPADSLQNYYNITIGNSYKVRYVKMEQIVEVGRTLNVAIHTATEKMDYNGGVLPREAYGTFPSAPATGPCGSTAIDDDASMSGTSVDPTSAESPWTRYENEPVPTSRMRNLSISYKPNQLLDLWPATTSATHTEAYSSAVSDKYAEYEAIFFMDDEVAPDSTSTTVRETLMAHGMFPRDETIQDSSTFINLTRLFVQICNYLSRIGSDNLSRGDFNTSTFCDTLLSLTEEEFAFLPLWAGGMNDGSGGVFATEIPLAERGAPSEPGPSYHTGSTLNSVASSEVDFDGESFSFVGGSGISEGGDTSMGVENGEDDHLARGIVVSEADFPMREERSDIGMAGMANTSSLAGAEVEVPLQVIKTPPVPSFIEDENFFNTPDEGEESEEDEDWDVMDDDDEGDETETEN